MAKILRHTILYILCSLICCSTIFFIGYRHVRNHQRDYTWAISIVKPILNLTTPHNAEFKHIYLEYVTESKKLHIILKQAEIRDATHQMTLSFDEIALELQPILVLLGKQPLHKIAADNFAIRIKPSVDGVSFEPRNFSRSNILQILDNIYHTSHLIYGTKIELKNGSLVIEPHASSSFTINIPSIVSKVHEDDYLIALDFGSNDTMSRFEILFRESHEHYVIRASIHAWNLKNIQDFIGHSKYREALIASDYDTILHAETNLTYTHKADFEELDINFTLDAKEAHDANHLKSLVAKASVKDHFKTFEVAQLDVIFGNNASFNTVASANFLKRGLFNKYNDLPTTVSINQTFKGIEVLQVLHFLPEGHAMEFRKWVIESMNNAQISSGRSALSLDQEFFKTYVIPDDAIKCDLVLENTRLNYYNVHPDLLIRSANLEFFNDYFIAQSENVTTDKGLVLDQVKARIPYNMQNLEIIGNGSGTSDSLMEFISVEDRATLESEGLNLEKLKAKFQIDFAVLVKHAPVLDASDIKFDINLKAKDRGVYSFEGTGYEIGNFNLILNGDRTLRIQGSFDYEDVPIRFVYDNQYHNQDGKFKMSIKITNEALQSSFFGNSIALDTGDLALRIESLAKGGYHVFCDATHNAINFMLFDFFKKVDSPMRAEGDLDSLNMGKFRLTNFAIFGEKFEIHVDIIRGKDILEMKLQNGFIDKITLNAAFIQTKDLEKLRLDANYLNLGTLLDRLFTINEDALYLPQRHEYQVKIKTAKLKDNILYSDILMQVSCNESICDNVLLDSTIADKYSFKIDQPFAEQKEKLRVYSDNAGLLLKSFGIYSDVEGGQLSMDLTQHVDLKPGDSNNIFSIQGSAKIHDFYAKNSSLLTKLVLGLTTLDGIGNIIANRNLYFSEMKLNLDYSDSILDVHKGKLLSTGLDITVDGSIDLKKKYVMLNGNLIPSVYGINKIISHTPLIGTILGGGSGGVIDAKYQVYGNFGDVKTFVNPLSILPLGFFKNLFR